MDRTPCPSALCQDPSNRPDMKLVQLYLDINAANIGLFDEGGRMNEVSLAR